MNMFSQWSIQSISTKQTTTSDLKITDHNKNQDIQVLAWDRHKHSFVDISGTGDHHCLHFLFKISTISVI